MSKGLIIVYIGKGKGKTTAAVGLAVRAAGAGLDVLFTQFVKAATAKQSGEWPLSSEIAPMRRIKKITVKILGMGFVGILGDNKLHLTHVKAARSGLRWLIKQIKSGKYDVVVADELISAIELKLLTVQEVKALYRYAEDFTALVLTGHNKYPELIADADLVTEMKLIKHPYYKGLLAQRGIDF
ncbi:MAG: cob(I)yrinic acid a,c-diamide adenosyltransferase [Candidatus Doudnabacteria bacterium]|nr:cob(I)yrinic acid a,c-diamide adenosyltransferase [Candidatus Doudnabacteria bacterium]